MRNSFYAALVFLKPLKTLDFWEIERDQRNDCHKMG